MLLQLPKSRDRFQSPDGDFVYSDACDGCGKEIEDDRFQSPDGDFVYSDQRVRME